MFEKDLSHPKKKTKASEREGSMSASVTVQSYSKKLFIFSSEKTLKFSDCCDSI